MKRIKLIHSVIPKIPVAEHPYIRLCSNPFDLHNGQMMFLYISYTQPRSPLFWMVWADNKGCIEAGASYFYKIN